MNIDKTTFLEDQFQTFWILAPITDNLMSRSRQIFPVPVRDPIQIALFNPGPDPNLTTRFEDPGYFCHHPASSDKFHALKVETCIPADEISQQAVERLRAESQRIAIHLDKCNMPLQFLLNEFCSAFREAAGMDVCSHAITGAMNLLHCFDEHISIIRAQIKD